MIPVKKTLPLVKDLTYDSVHLLYATRSVLNGCKLDKSKATRSVRLQGIISTVQIFVIKRDQHVDRRRWSQLRRDHACRTQHQDRALWF